MSKKFIVLSSALFCTLFIFSNISYAMRLLTQEEALKKIFGPEAKIVTETKTLNEAVFAKIKDRLGGSIICYQKGAKGAELEENAPINFYFALKDEQKIGVAIIDTEPGKWGPVEFIVALDLQGVVTRVEVLSYEEKRGQPIARHSFMSQYEGKTSKNILEVGKDITSISGATISSRCATFAVKKAIVLYEELYLNK